LTHFAFSHQHIFALAHCIFRRASALPHRRDLQRREQEKGSPVKAAFFFLGA
jgi:hypothetical protein